MLQKGSVDSTPAFTAGTTYTVYTGIGNTATYEDGVASDTKTAATYVLYTAKGYAMAVVGLNGVLDTSTTSDYTVVFAASGATTNYVSGGENYYTYKAVVNGEIVNAYEATSASLFAKGETYYVDSFDDGRADGVVVGGDATTRIVKTNSITGIKLENNTLSLFTTGDTFNRAAVLSEDAQMFVFDTRNNADTIEEVTSLSGLAGTTWSVTTVQTSGTDTSIAYVFVTITA